MPRALVTIMLCDTWLQNIACVNGPSHTNHNRMCFYSLQSAAFAGNPFAYINGSDAVTGGISEISLKYPNGTPKVVKNLEKPFELMMQNKNPPEPEIHLFDLDKTKTLTFDVVKNRSAVLVQVYPVENNTQIVVCLKKGSKPSGFGNCDFLEVLPKAISVNDSSFNPNSLLVPAAAWNHSAAGKWFVSFKYNGTVDAANAPASSNCTVYIFEAACIYMDPDTEEFSSEGMTVNIVFLHWAFRFCHGYDLFSLVCLLYRYCLYRYCLCLSVYICYCLYIYIYILSVSVCLCLSVCICLSVSVCLCLSVCLSIYATVYIDIFCLLCRCVWV